MPGTLIVNQFLQIEFRFGCTGWTLGEISQDSRSPQCKPFRKEWWERLRLRLTQPGPPQIFSVLRDFAQRGANLRACPGRSLCPLAGGLTNQCAQLAPVCFLRKLPGKTKSSTFLHNFQRYIRLPAGRRCREQSVIWMITEHRSGPI